MRGGSKSLVTVERFPSRAADLPSAAPGGTRCFVTPSSTREPDWLDGVCFPEQLPTTNENHVIQGTCRKIETPRK